MKYSRCDNSNICTDSLNKMTSTTTTNNINSNMKMSLSPVASSGFMSDLSPTPSNNPSSQFAEDFRTVDSFFDKWSDCERTVVLYALLKRLRYPCLKFLQYSIDNNLTQHSISQSTVNAVLAEINANNPSYLQNLFNAYNTFHLGDIVETFSSPSSSSSTSSCASDKESMPCYGSADFQLKPNSDERKLYGKKEDILHEVLDILPLLKPGNEDAKTIYLSLIPNAVKDTLKQIVPPELVQQIFSYLLIHPAVTSEDRRSLHIWLRQLEDFLIGSQRAANSFLRPANSEFLSSGSSSGCGSGGSSNNSSNTDSLMITSVCSASSSCSSSSGASCNSINGSNSSCVGNTNLIASTAQRNADWQTIAPPAKFKQQYQQRPQQQQPKISQLTDWCDVMTRRRQSCGGISTSMADQLCDNFNGITLNELGSSHSNSLGLSSLVGDSATSIDGKESSLVNGVVAAAASAEAAAAASQSSLFCGGGNNNKKTNPIINIIGNNGGEELVTDDHDTSFSKNGTDFDFEPLNSDCNSCTNSTSQFPSSKEFGPPQPFSSLFLSNIDQVDGNRWSLDSKIASLKTRRSNSLTTQTLSSSSSSNSSVITVNDNCSNSTENLAQFANKPRSFSLSIENQQRGALINGGSETRLDDFKPNYIKFQTRNVGMSNIGSWLKSLRLHKYVELFYNLTYEDMLQITEEYLQNLGVTKGASHKLALCIEKLKERPTVLAKLEQDLINGKQPVSKAIEDLTSMVLTPMKPVESSDNNSPEDNVALLFLRVIELVCSKVQRDPYTLSEDECLNSIVWILDRAIHSEAFINHINQLKDLKFQISKLKIAFAPRLHYAKGNGGNTSIANVNKARWNSKTRKCDSKNGSNDRINYRKNSADMLNFPGQQNGSDYSQMTNSGSETNSQYKNSAFSKFMNQHTQQVQQQQSQQKHSQYPTHIAQQSNQFPSLPQPTNQVPQQQKHHQQHHQQQQQPTIHQQQQNGRSLNNLIVVSGGPQQPQKMVFKPGSHQQGVLSMNNSIRASADNLQTEKITHHQQQRKGSLASVLNHNNNNMSSNTSGNNNKSSKISTSSNAFSSSKVTKTQNSQNNDSLQHQQKKTMAAVVMVSNENLAADNIMISQQNRQQSQQNSITTLPTQMLKNSNANILSDDINLLSQHQLQFLAAATATVASCRNLKNDSNLLADTAAHCICSSSSSSSNTNNNPNITSNNNNINNNSSHNNNNNNIINSCNHCSTCKNCCERSLSTMLSVSNCVDTATTLVVTQTVNQILIGENSQSNYENNTTNNNNPNHINDIKSLQQLETLCLEMTEQAIN